MVALVKLRAHLAERRTERLMPAQVREQRETLAAQIFRDDSLSPDQALSTMEALYASDEYPTWVLVCEAVDEVMENASGFVVGGLAAGVAVSIPGLVVARIDGAHAPLAHAFYVLAGAVFLLGCVPFIMAWVTFPFLLARGAWRWTRSRRRTA